MFLFCFSPIVFSIWMRWIWDIQQNPAGSVSHTLVSLPRWLMMFSCLQWDQLIISPLVQARPLMQLLGNLCSLFLSRCPPLCLSSQLAGLSDGLEWCKSALADREICALSQGVKLSPLQIIHNVNLSLRSRPVLFASVQHMMVKFSWPDVSLSVSKIMCLQQNRKTNQIQHTQHTQLVS